MAARWRMILSWSGVAVWAAVIFGLSSIPASNLPPGKYGTAGHFMLYLILGALLFLALGGEPRGRALRAVALASAYGVSDEVHQLFVAGRRADPVDWLVDTTGALVAVVILLAAARWRTDAQKR